MKYDKVSRRHFLQGLGGFALAMPTLTSLLSESARAQAISIKPAVILSRLHHGCGWPENIWPNPLNTPMGDHLSLINHSYLTETSNAFQNYLFPQYDIRYRNLDGLGHTDSTTGRMQFSKMLGPELFDLKNKLTLIRGLSATCSEYGHWDGSWGSYKSFSNHPNPNVAENWSSIDHVLAKFLYEENNNRLHDVFNIDSFGKASVLKDGSYFTSNTDSFQAMYQSLFGQQSGNATNSNPYQYAMDKVLEDYNRILSPGSRLGQRISHADKMKLESFATLVHEAQTRLNTNLSCGNTTTTSSSSSTPNTQGSLEIAKQNLNSLADMIAISIICGGTKIFNVTLDFDFLNYSSETSPTSAGSLLHIDYAHQVYQLSPDDPKTEYWVNGFRLCLEEFFARLGKKLDEVEISNGKTHLDNSLLVGTFEAGDWGNHQLTNLPAFCLGSMNGKFRTNKYIDLRQMNNLGASGTNNYKKPGFPIQGFLASILYNAGLSKSNFLEGYGGSSPLSTFSGYGDQYVHNVEGYKGFLGQGHVCYPNVLMSKMDEGVPVWDKRYNI